MSDGTRNDPVVRARPRGREAGETDDRVVDPDDVVEVREPPPAFEDAEVPEADALEQAQDADPAVPPAPRRHAIREDVSEADAWEQQLPVVGRDEY